MRSAYYAIIVILCIVAGFVLDRADFLQPSVGSVSLSSIHETKLNCTSHSMEPGITCNDTLLWKQVPSDAELHIGAVYIYEGEDHQVAHRYLGCEDVACDLLLFKGDNNLTHDPPVKRSAVVAEVVGIVYD